LPIYASYTPQKLSINKELQRAPELSELLQKLAHSASSKHQKPAAIVDQTWLESDSWLTSGICANLTLNIKSNEIYEFMNFKIRSVLLGTLRGH